MTAIMAGWSGAEKGQGAVQPTINTAGMPAAEMACGMDPSTSSWKIEQQTLAVW